MRSLSSIIKGERIRTHSVIDFSTRQVEKSIQEKYIKETTEQINFQQEEQLIDFKEEKLKEVQKVVDEKLKEADFKVRQMLLEAVEKANTLQEEANQLKTQILFEIEEQKAVILEEAQQKAERIIAGAYEEKKEIIKNTEDELVETLIGLLNHIISEEMNYHSDWVKCLVRKMLNKEGISGRIKVIISPILYTRLSENELQAIEAISKDLIVETREQINETTCIIEFNQGSIVYDIAQGLERVIKDIRMLMNTK